MDWFAAWTRSHAGLDNKAEPVAGDLPALTVRQTSMRQCSLAPAGVEEADPAVFIGHVRGCRLHDLTVEVELQGCLPPLRFQNVMHYAHKSQHALSRLPLSPCTLEAKATRRDI